jgi:hypothetical protein
MYYMELYKLYFCLWFGWNRFDSWQRQDIFFTPRASRSSLGSLNLLSIGCQTCSGWYHSHILLKLRISGALLPFSPHICLAWCLIKHRDNNFTAYVWFIFIQDAVPLNYSYYMMYVLFCFFHLCCNVCLLKS